MARKETAISWALFVILLSATFLVLFHEQKEPTIVTIADAEQPGFGLVYIAQKKGYFAQQGVKVDIRKFRFGKDALQDVLEGNSDLATLYETPFVKALLEDKPVSALTALHYSTRNTWIAANGDVAKEPRDLAGKRFATIKGTNLEFFLSEFLMTNGLADSSPHIAYAASMEEEVAMLSKGQVDAIVVWNTSPETISKGARKPIVAFLSDAYVENSVLAGTTDKIMSDPETMRKIITALARAEDFYRKNPDEARRIVEAETDGHLYWDMDATWRNISLDLRLDNVLLAELEQEAEFYQATEFPGSVVPQFRKSIVTTYLREISPESVTLF